MHYQAGQLLKHQAEIELWKRGRAGDLAARNELVERNMLLVPFGLKKIFRGRPVPEDCVSVGYIILIRCAELWDPNVGMFSTYVCGAMRYVALNYIRDQRKAREFQPLAGEQMDPEAGDGRDLLDLLAADNDTVDEAAQREAGDIAQAILEKLPAREREAVERRVMHEQRLRDVGAALGVSKERARQITDRGMEMARTAADRNRKTRRRVASL